MRERDYQIPRCRAAGYLTLAAVAKCLQAATWLVARGNKKTGTTSTDIYAVGDYCYIFFWKLQKIL